MKLTSSASLDGRRLQLISVLADTGRSHNEVWHVDQVDPWRYADNRG
jgi:hypothetical protein